MGKDLSFSAKDATKLVEDYNNLLEGESRKEYIKIISIITEAARCGKSHIDFDDQLSMPIVNELRKNLFEVCLISNQYESSYTLVSW